MKAKSINFIRNMLIDETKKAEDAYDLLRDRLRCKYKNDWIRSMANKAELELLDNLYEKRNDLIMTLEDFEQHQW